MARIALVEIGFFLLPFLAYALYLALTRSRISRSDFMRGPLAWLAIVGLFAAGAGFFVLAHLDRTSPGGTYRPAQYIDGVFVPGRVE